MKPKFLHMYKMHKFIFALSKQKIPKEKPPHRGDARGADEPRLFLEKKEGKEE